MEPRAVTPPPRPQAHPAGEPMPSSPIEAAQDGESLPSAEPIAPSRRWVMIVGAFTVTAILIVATVWFDRTQTPSSFGLALT